MQPFTLSQDSKGGEEKGSNITTWEQNEVDATLGMYPNLGHNKTFTWPEAKPIQGLQLIPMAQMENPLNLPKPQINPMREHVQSGKVLAASPHV